MYKNKGALNGRSVCGAISTYLFTEVEQKPVDFSKIK